MTLTPTNNDPPKEAKMNTTGYLYRVSGTQYSLVVEVGTFDPNRWPSNDNPGGISFGESAEMRVSERGFRDETLVAEVSMGAIGSHSTEVGRRRIDVYGQACEIADFATESIAAGFGIEAIGAALSEALSQDPSCPAARPFSAGRAALALVRSGS